MGEQTADHEHIIVFDTLFIELVRIFQLLSIEEEDNFFNFDPGLNGEYEKNVEAAGKVPQHSPTLSRLVPEQIINIKMEVSSRPQPKSRGRGRQLEMTKFGQHQSMR